jgi:TfoX/Sxy family transcriptional regulator of competence genes
MGTDESFMEHVVDQARLAGRLTYRKMFGEYGIYLDGKFIALACDNRLFVKPTQAILDHGLDVPALPPYPKGKPHPMIDELLDDPDLLRRVFEDTAKYLPEPKEKASKKRRK